MGIETYPRRCMQAIKKGCDAFHSFGKDVVIVRSEPMVSSCTDVREVAMCVGVMGVKCQILELLQLGTGTCSY